MALNYAWHWVLQLFYVMISCRIMSKTPKVLLKTTQELADDASEVLTIVYLYTSLFGWGESQVFMGFMGLGDFMDVC